MCLAGKGKVKIKGRTPKGGGDQMEPNPVGVPNIGGRGMGGSAPATPTEAETCNQSTTGWSRNSLRGSKCNFFFSYLMVDHSSADPFARAESAKDDRNKSTETIAFASGCNVESMRSSKSSTLFHFLKKIQSIASCNFYNILRVTTIQL